MNHDRRQHPRIIPDSALLVSLGQAKRGFLSDISEGGMAFDGFPPKNGNNVIYLAFDLPEGAGSIEAIAEVMWTCDSLHRTGVRFLELAAASRRQLSNWVSSRVFTLNPKEIPQAKPQENRERGEGSEIGANRVAAPLAAELPLAPPPQGSRQPARLDPIPEPVSIRPPSRYQWHDQTNEQRGDQDERQLIASSREAVASQVKLRHQKQPHPIGIILAIVFVSTACVSLGYYLPGMFQGRKTGGSSVASQSPISSTSHGSIVSVSQPAATKPASVPPRGANGFVLQAGAMSHPENASALAAKLQQKNFPAFVSNPSKGGLYRVDVGPYPDESHARAVEDELKAAGFAVILQHSPAPAPSN